jgi:hypothetical protein
MRQTISGLIAAIAVMTVGAAPAMACGGGWGYGGCAPAPVYVSPAPVYGYSGCNVGCGGWAHERLPDPVHQYYYVNQGPTYTGPGNFAPYPTYEEDAVSYRHRYGYAPRRHYGHRGPVLRRYY